jgi:hypothetical protein
MDMNPPATFIAPALMNWFIILVRSGSFGVIDVTEYASTTARGTTVVVVWTPTMYSTPGVRLQKRKAPRSSVV